MSIQVYIISVLKASPLFLLNDLLDLSNKIPGGWGMDKEKEACCTCCCQGKKKGKQMTLAELPVGTSATIVKVMPKLRGQKKFADVGLVVGSELLMEAHAPLGGLLRVKVMETSMALHKSDAANFLIEQEDGDAK